METHAHPFAFLLLGWSCGFFSSVFLHVFVRTVFPTREIEQALG
jgi:hypothetical protein